VLSFCALALSIPALIGAWCVPMPVIAPHRLPAPKGGPMPGRRRAQHTWLRMGVASVACVFVFSGSAMLWRCPTPSAPWPERFGPDSMSD
jgi:hypothetical protein